MIVDCPHCHGRVIPMTGHICPACRKDMRQPSDGDPNMVRVSFDDAQQLPAICVTCGKKTGETTRLVRRGYDQPSRQRGEDSTAAFTGLFGLLGLTIFRLLGFGKKTVSRAIPLCEDCRAAQGVSVLTTDFERNRFTILAHRSFREQLHGITKQPGAADGQAAADP